MFFIFAREDFSEPGDEELGFVSKLTLNKIIHAERNACQRFT